MRQVHLMAYTAKIESHHGLGIGISECSWETAANETLEGAFALF